MDICRRSDVSGGVVCTCKIESTINNCKCLNVLTSEVYLYRLVFFFYSCFCLITFLLCLFKLFLLFFLSPSREQNLPTLICNGDNPFRLGSFGGVQASFERFRCQVC